MLLALAAGITLGARAVGGGHRAESPGQSRCAGRRREATATATERKVPDEIRGVHVTMGLASLPGKLAEYLALPGLNAIELDVKDENGRVGFVPSSVPLARRTGAASPYYNGEARSPARSTRKGVYLIGRVVTFEDPVLSEKRPDLAIRTSDGSIWHNNARPRLDEPVRPAGLATTTSTSPLPRCGPASTRSSSTTCASRATATSR